MPRNQSLGLFPSSEYKNFTMNDLALSQRMTYSKENELDTIKEYLSLFSELSLTEFIEELYSNCNAEQRLTYEIFKDEISIDGIVLFFEEQIYIIKKVAFFTISKCSSSLFKIQYPSFFTWRINSHLQSI